MWTQVRCQTKNKNKKNQPSTGFYPGTVLQKAKPRFEPSGALREKQPPSTGSTQER